MQNIFNEYWIRGGFTLIELLVVISIISLLSSVVLSSISSARESARDTRRKQDMQQIQRAVAQYRLDNGYIPGRGGGCNTCDGRPLDDQSFCVVDELKSYFNGTVPTDPRSGDSGYYYAYDPCHLDSKDICGENVEGGAISFHTSETGIQDRETNDGCDESICSADFNRMICWQ